jgi:tRNA pseudouridine55 synthase
VSVAAIDGALLLDKALGLSSNAALQQAKRLFAASKAGHAGTLDPLASGLLLVLFGEATKFAGPQLDGDKEYLATLQLGATTTTGDAEGEVLERREVKTDEKLIQDVLGRFRGEIEQIPPMYSALKRDGVPLYKLARRGEEVERKPRRVQIAQLDLKAFKNPFMEIQVRCSKGTYIRSLAQDIGAALGSGAHLAALRRTASGRFRIEQAATLEALAGMTPPQRQERLLPLADLLAGLPRAELDAPAAARLRNGQTLPMSGLGEGICGIYGPGGAVIGLGRCDGAGLHPLRLTQETEKHR